MFKLSSLTYTTLLCMLVAWCCVGGVNGIGANWGTQASHQLPAQTVVQLLKDNGIMKVKLFDADYHNLKLLGNTGIEVMVGIPNDKLYSLATSQKAADKWVSENITSHISTVNIRYTLLFILAELLYVCISLFRLCPFIAQLVDLLMFGVSMHPCEA